MSSPLLSASTISVGSFAFGQIVRFLSNILLAKMLAPSSFGLMAIVNMVMLGLALLSDLGLRMVVIQSKNEPTPLFLNTIWVLQVLRGVGLWVLATFAGLLLIALQALDVVAGNVYADPLLPYMVIVGAFGVLFAGVESVNSMLAARSMEVQRIAIVGLAVQLLSIAATLGLAYTIESPWALVAGGLVGAALQCAASFLCFGRNRNYWQFDKCIAVDILKKARWFLISSPLTFLELNGAILLLGAMLNPTQLGHFMIAFSIVGVFRLISQQLTGSIMFPTFSACFRETPRQISRLVFKFQLATDAILVMVAGGLFVAGPAIIALLFDYRYADAGKLVSILGIGLIGSRQCVVEQLITAKGWFKSIPLVILPRLLILITGTVGGYYSDGIEGAAWGIALSWFAAWPYIYWKRLQLLAWSVPSELLGLLMFCLGCMVGYAFVMLLQFVPKTLFLN